MDSRVVRIFTRSRERDLLNEYLLPEYPMGPEFQENFLEHGVKDRVMKWGVTAHFMNEEYYKDPIIKKMKLDSEEPPSTKDELGSLAHWHLWKLFKELFLELYNFLNSINEKFINDFMRNNTN